MASKIVAVSRFLFALAIVLVVGWLGYVALARVAYWLANLRSEIAVAIVAAGASVTVSILSLVISKSLEARRAIAQELRAKKTPIYEEFIDTLYKTLFAERVGKEPPTQAELMQFFADYTEKLTIWGSDDVIKVWGRLRLSGVSGMEGVQMLFLYEDLLLEIRKDLGHRNKGFRLGKETSKHSGFITVQ
jgi:hypothetical protein